MKVPMVFPLALLACASCGDDPAGSCTIVDTAHAECVDYGIGYTSNGVQAACSMPDGSSTMYSFASAACTATGRVGACLLTGGGRTSTENYYTGQVSDWMPSCQMRGGTWSTN